MYVCVCKAVTDRQIRNAIYTGACRMRDLRQRLGICSTCGTCGQYAQRILRDCLAETVPEVSSSYQA